MIAGVGAGPGRGEWPGISSVRHQLFLLLETSLPGLHIHEIANADEMAAAE